MKILPLATSLVLVAVGLAAADGLHAPPRQPSAPGVTTPASAPSRPAQVPLQRKPKIAVAFRLDPDLTRGLFLGERWVSPPSFFFAQPGTQYVAQARAQWVDARGERTDVAADWATTDPELIALTRHASGDATIVVRHPGDGAFTATSHFGTRRVEVHARQAGDGMQVDFRQ